MSVGPDRPVGGLAVRPPAGVELRPAARDDLDAVLALLAQRESAPALEIEPGAAAERWEVFLRSIDSAPFLAVADGEPAAVLLLSFRRRLNFATWEGSVPELVVSAGHRRRGIGRALLRVAIEEWRLRGAHRLAVELAPGEEAGRALLSGMGFQDMFLRFSLDPIGPERQQAAHPASVTLRSLREDDFPAASRLVAEMGAHRSPLPDRIDAVQRAYREIIRRSTNGTVQRSGSQQSRFGRHSVARRPRPGSPSSSLPSNRAVRESAARSWKARCRLPANEAPSESRSSLARSA